jgi:hypothetical protein
MNSEGRNEVRTLAGGQCLGLVRPPGEKWRIQSFRHSEVYRSCSPELIKDGSGGLLVVGVLESRRDMPSAWLDMRFDTADEAVAFVEGAITLQAHP